MLFPLYSAPAERKKPVPELGRGGRGCQRGWGWWDYIQREAPLGARKIRCARPSRFESNAFVVWWKGFHSFEWNTLMRGSFIRQWAAAPRYRKESERCKLIMYMKSFWDTDRTTGSLWSSRKALLCLQQQGIHTQPGRKLLLKQYLLLFHPRNKTRVRKWQGWKALSGKRTRLQLRMLCCLRNAASRLIRSD